MSSVFQVSEVIEADIDAVWDVLVDWDRAPDWMSNVESIRVEGETAPGSRLIVRARGRETTSTVAACESPRRLTLESVQGNVRASYEYSLESVGSASTSATLHASCDMDGVLLKVFGGLVRMAIRRADSGQVRALRELVEAGSPRDGQ